MTRRSYLGAFSGSLAAAEIAEAQDTQAAKLSSGAITDLSSFGIKADGITDDTAAIQKALDAAGKNGETVRLPPARYLVKGNLTVPPGVSLEGVHDAPVGQGPLTGTVILTTAGRDKEDGPALFEMSSAAMVRALMIFYPEQMPTDVHPYPWTFHLRGTDGTVENLTIVNTYNAIRVGPETNGRHRLRSVVGCALRRGVYVDNTREIGRVDNVHWHCDFWGNRAINGNRPAVYEYMWKNLEAFTFARTDWEYVTNTFVFPVKTGYRFIKTPAGACNGQFSGIGADSAQRCVSVEAIQPMGLLITNGEFVCIPGERIQVVIEPTCAGSVRLVNCAFWGPSRQCVASHGTGYLSLSDCYIEISGRMPPGPPDQISLVEADSGRLQVRGCTLRSRGKEPNIVLKKGLTHAIIAENNGPKGVSIVNEIGEQAIIANNEPPVPTA
ncbi:MAG TPA: glycosyl hydrolase family 28-related protein [Bryobacteraceae bacterium]|nr:glycosyl hydrolase family 28-related protein [Bryobacteraceae bacterium]